MIMAVRKKWVHRNKLIKQKLGSKSKFDVNGTFLKCTYFSKFKAHSVNLNVGSFILYNEKSFFLTLLLKWL